MDMGVWVYGWRVCVCGGCMCVGCGTVCVGGWGGWVYGVGVCRGVGRVCGEVVCAFCFCFSKPFTFPQNNVKYLFCFYFAYLSFFGQSLVHITCP